MGHEITREDLYDRVWETPLKRLAPEFEIEPGKLSEACKEFGIPLPGPGYWTLKEMGKLTERAPLGAPPSELGDIVNLEAAPKRARAMPKTPKVVTVPVSPALAEHAIEQHTLSPAEAEDTAAGGPAIHSLVARTHAKLLAVKVGETTGVGGRRSFAVAASATHADLREPGFQGRRGGHDPSAERPAEHKEIALTRRAIPVRELLAIAIRDTPRGVSCCFSSLPARCKIRLDELGFNEIPSRRR